MDVASTIPYEAIGFFLTGKHKLGLPYFLLGMLRFWRIRRVKQFFTRFSIFIFLINDPLILPYSFVNAC
jgi:hypothetical protein